MSDFILVPLSDLIAKAPLSRFDHTFPLVSRSTPETSKAAILRSALVILVAAKERVLRFMFN
jgi:hypothetical protein